MYRELIKKIALGITLMQLFSCGSIAKADTPKYVRPSQIPQYIVVDDSNENNIIYHRYNRDTGEYEPIKVFDERNIGLEQYGAYQSALYKHFDLIYKEPVIQEELEQIYPVSSFDSKGEARLYHKLFFKVLGESGCGFAAGTDLAFHYFEGQEADFYEKMGYPMYTVDNIYIDFNYEFFMLKYFDYYLKRSGRVEEMRKYVMPMVYEEEIEAYKEAQNNIRPSHAEFRNWTKEQYDEWRKKDDYYDEKIKEYQNKLKKIPQYGEKFWGVPFNEHFGYLDDYLRQFGVSVKCSMKNGTSGTRQYTVIASEDYTLYSRGYTEYDYTDTGAHYMYVVEVTEDGKIVVSSWGNMFVFDGSDAKYTTRFEFKRKK